MRQFKHVALSVLQTLLHTSSQSCLGIIGHGITLVQDDQLELVAAQACMVRMQI
jgi:hypothetical protein